jgi:hypothetical protein
MIFVGVVLMVHIQYMVVFVLRAAVVSGCMRY